MELSRRHNAPIIPVDSEHSAIFQCLVGEPLQRVEKIILTASGGPFLDKELSALEGVTPEAALDHPNWCMGPKITIDSATMMNKGLEVIEAKWLFDLTPDQIEVIIHPQSIIHSMVQFADGSMKAQMGLPDMRLPIQYAMAFPDRIPSDFERFDFTSYPELSFRKPDMEKFRNLAIAFECMEKGGNWPCIMNAANEVAVEEFLNGRISFTGIPALIEQTLEQSRFILDPSLEELTNSDREARLHIEKLITA